MPTQLIAWSVAARDPSASAASWASTRLCSASKAAPPRVPTALLLGVRSERAAVEEAEEADGLK